MDYHLGSDTDSDTDLDVDTDPTDLDFQPSRKVVVSLNPAPKRKQLRSSLGDADLAETSNEPAPKRVKINKDNNHEPIAVNFKHLKEQILSLPWELQDLIRVQCIAARVNNVPFVQAFLSSRDIMLHSSNMYRTITDTEVVLTGKTFLKDFRRLHPAVIQLARKLKVVYITKDVGMCAREFKKRQSAYEKTLATYHKYERLIAAGYLTAEYCPPLPDVPIQKRHKMYPMGEPRFGSENTQVLLACRKFISVHELTIDLTSHITYNGVDKKKLAPDQWYGNRVGEHIQAAIGYSGSARQGIWENPKLKEGKNVLKKLTLVLGSAETSKDEVSENKFAAARLGSPYLGPHDAPNWQWLRFWFRQSLNLGGGYDPSIHTPLTEFSMDKEAGVVSYSRKGYTG